MKIIFYSKWHLGDLFHFKGYIQDLKKQRPDLEIVYAHNCAPRAMADISDYVDVDFLPEEMSYDWKKGYIDKENNCVYINAHSGNYSRPSGEPHSNWTSLNQNWGDIHALLAQAGVHVEYHKNRPDLYIPTIDFSFYARLYKTDQFINQTQGRKKILLCNGGVRAGQSEVGNLYDPVVRLALEFPNCIFIVTEKFYPFPEHIKNIVSTHDLFQLTHDANEIAYLSTFCDAIVGKNSGPYMFTHMKDNFFRNNLTFLTLGNRVTDSYPCHMRWNNGCRYIYSGTNNNDHIVNILRDIITKPFSNPGYIEQM